MLHPGLRLPAPGLVARRRPSRSSLRSGPGAQQEWKAGDYNVAYQSCDDATAQAAKWDSGKCSQNANAYAVNDSLIGVIGHIQLRCAAIEIPVLNKAQDGGIPMLVARRTRWSASRQRAPSCDSTEPDKYYPTGDAELPARRAVRRVPGCCRRRVREGSGRQEHIHPERQGGVRRRRRDELRDAAESLGIEIVGDEAWDPKASSYRRSSTRSRDGSRRHLPRRAHLRERRPGDQGQGRRARPERRRGEVVRTGRVRRCNDRRSRAPPRPGCSSRSRVAPVDKITGKASAEFVDGS